MAKRDPSPGPAAPMAALFVQRLDLVSDDVPAEAITMSDMVDAMIAASPQLARKTRGALEQAARRNLSAALAAGTVRRGRVGRSWYYWFDHAEPKGTPAKTKA